MAVDSEVLKNVNVYLFLDNFKEFWLTREFFYFYKGKKKTLKRFNYSNNRKWELCFLKENRIYGNVAHNI